MERGSVKIAIAAVGAGLATVLILLTRLPLMFAPLTFAAVCYYIVFEKAGVVHGFLCIAVASSLAFITGPGAGPFLNLLLFAPYSVLAFFIRGIRYDKLKTGILRASIMLVFSNLVFMAVFFLTDTLFSELKILETVNRFVGGYFTAAVVVTLAGLVIDVFFAYGCRILCAKIGSKGR